MTANKSDPFTADKNGQAYHIGQQAIQNVPTVNRSLGDLTKLMPQGNKNSFGGANYRFNNLSIDGMATNDVLGFQEPASGAAGSVAAGTPGALAGTQPISIDAIDEISVVISPFNVTLGNFTGANINAVTKSGTNRFAGSVYGFARNQVITGRSVDGQRTPIYKYYDVQSGVSLGGPIIKNKLFFFGNYEIAAPRGAGVVCARCARRQRAAGSGPANQRAFCKAQYGYDPGTFGDADHQAQQRQVFAAPRLQPLRQAPPRRCATTTWPALPTTSNARPRCSTSATRASGTTAAPTAWWPS